MSWMAVATVGSAAIGAYSSNKASKAAAKGAAEGAAVEERMADKNLAFQREMAEMQREDFAPWRDVGGDALNRIWQGVQTGEFEVGNIDLTKDPGYQFRMDQGIQAIDRSAAARGRLLSGAQQKALTQYGQDVGSQEYANAYARESDKLARRYNILSNLSAGGQASAAGQAQAAGQLAQTGGNIMSNTGRALNVGAQQAGSARAGAYEGYAQSANQAMQNWMQYKAQKDSAQAPAGGGGGGGGGGILGSIGGMFSDSRLKDNIHHVGNLDSGLPWYMWDWSEDALELVGDQPSEGVMVEEAAQLYPDAIGEREGYLTVDYSKIH
tara:strand:+ start:4177 stop:5148 length:972 start_codon:yes stop_codon:yes gene_type:complete